MSFYVPTPICAASRAGLLTGRFPGRVGIPWNPPKRLKPGEIVIASLDQNTLVIFMSDNGPVIPPGSAGPWSGGKFSCEEGGVRVPPACAGRRGSGPGAWSTRS